VMCTLKNFLNCHELLLTIQSATHFTSLVRLRSCIGPHTAPL
jgi:hypothetical protein